MKNNTTIEFRGFDGFCEAIFHKNLIWILYMLGNPEDGIVTQINQIHTQSHLRPIELAVSTLDFDSKTEIILKLLLLANANPTLAIRIAKKKNYPAESINLLRKGASAIKQDDIARRLAVAGTQQEVHELLESVKITPDAQTTQPPSVTEPDADATRSQRHSSHDRPSSSRKRARTASSSPSRRVSSGSGSRGRSRSPPPRRPKVSTSSPPAGRRRHRSSSPVHHQGQPHLAGSRRSSSPPELEPVHLQSDSLVAPDVLAGAEFPSLPSPRETPQPVELIQPIPSAAQDFKEAVGRELTPKELSYFRLPEYPSRGASQAQVDAWADEQIQLRLPPSAALPAVVRWQFEHGVLPHSLEWRSRKCRSWPPRAGKDMCPGATCFFSHSPDELRTHGRLVNPPRPSVGSYAPWERPGVPAKWIEDKIRLFEKRFSKRATPEEAAYIKYTDRPLRRASQRVVDAWAEQQSRLRLPSTESEPDVVRWMVEQNDAPWAEWRSERCYRWPPRAGQEACRGAPCWYAHSEEELRCQGRLVNPAREPLPPPRPSAELQVDETASGATESLTSQLISKYKREVDPNPSRYDFACLRPITPPPTNDQTRLDQWARNQDDKRFPADHPEAPPTVISWLIENKFRYHTLHQPWRHAQCRAWPPLVGQEICRGKHCWYAHSKAELRRRNGELVHPDLNEERAQE